VKGEEIICCCDGVFVVVMVAVVRENYLDWVTYRVIDLSLSPAISPLYPAETRSKLHTLPVPQGVVERHQDGYCCCVLAYVEGGGKREELAAAEAMMTCTRQIPAPTPSDPFPPPFHPSIPFPLDPLYYYFSCPWHVASMVAKDSFMC